MSQARDVHFHVGAHKTATTYMQSRLRSNKERLRNEGIDFIDLWAKRDEEAAYRKALKAAIEGNRVDEEELAHASTRLRELVDVSSSSSSLVLMSYENVLGDFDLTKGRFPYPNVEPAIRHIASAFSDCNLKIFFSFRSLDRFVESGYVQRVCTRSETRKFKDYLDHIDTNSVSWMPVVRAIASIVGCDNVVAWAYENFVVDERPVWNALLSRGNGDATLARPAKKVNNSLSGKGLKYMRGINRLATAADARKFRTFIRRNFAAQSGQKPPRLLDDARREALTSNYEQNCRELGSTCRLLLWSPHDD